MASQPACTYTFFTVLLIAIFYSPSASCVLVPSTPLNLQYHKGPLLAGDGPIELHLTFYGDFTSLEKDTIKSFLHSLSDTPSYIAQFSSYKKALHKSRRLSLKSPSRSASELKPLVMKTSSTEEHSKPLAGSGSSIKFSRDASKDPSFMSEPSPTVAKWWSLTQAYTDLRGNGVSQTVLIEHEASDNYSHGTHLSHSDIATLAKRSARRAARRVSHAAAGNFQSIHLIISAADVAVEGFCMHSCGQHAHTESDGDLGKVVYAWVGNAREQCPGYCAWPFVRAEYGPDIEPLRAPNSPSADGMIINLAKVLVEAATNPYGDGYYLGGGSYGVGVGGACTGAYGDGAFPGYPGRALQDPITGASFNVKGIEHFKFLLPYIWNPLTISCVVQP